MAAEANNENVDDTRNVDNMYKVDNVGIHMNAFTNKKKLTLNLQRKRMLLLKKN